MIALAMLSLVVALLACGWTTAYAWTDALPNLLWLERARVEDAWLDGLVDMQLQLAAWQAVDPDLQDVTA